MAFYDPTMFEVHVLLVDQDLNSLYETTRLLHFNSYKVTSVVDAGLASSILSKGNTTFNLVMVEVEVQPPRFQGFQIMNEALKMDLPVIVMSTSATPMLVKCAIEEGAFLFMQKPPTQEDLKYLWQHIVREGSRRNKGKGMISTNHFSFMYKGETSSSVNAQSEIFSSSSSDNGKVQCTSMKPKMCTEWTPELHEKFMNAVNKLGDERCFPKDILELMNVKGLTRMQVASHLQKCRLGWKPSNEKSSVRRQKAPKSPNPSSNKGKKYGLLPNMARSYVPQFPSDIPQNEEQVHVPSSGNANTQSSFIISESDFMLNMSQHGIWVDVPFANNNNNMNEIFLDENFMNGHMLVGPSDYMLQPHEASFDFAATDHGLMIGNNFNNEFDLDQVFIGEAYEVGSTSAPTPSVGVGVAAADDDNGTNDAAMDSEDFGDSWIDEIPREL